MGVCHDTLYGQQDYSLSILIHNATDKELEVKFEGNNNITIIDVGEEKII